MTEPNEKFVTQEVIGLDLTKPHTYHSEDKKITTYDQNGFIYDGLTQQVLDHKHPKSKERYAIPEGAPFSKVKTVDEKINDAIATMRASGSLDADTLSNFERLLKTQMREGKKA